MGVGCPRHAGQAVIAVMVLQVTGAIVLLCGFLATLTGRTTERSVAYLLLNGVGAAVLAVVAVIGRAWGFALLEVVWSAAAWVRLACILRVQRDRLAPTDIGEIQENTATVASTGVVNRDPDVGAGPPVDWRPLLPPVHDVALAGDELRSQARLIHLFRDTYAASQGRQWLQPMVLAWTLRFLRQHGAEPDWRELERDDLARSVSGLLLPPGHTAVHPGKQKTMNFAFWWTLLGHMVHLEYQPTHGRRRRPLPAPPDLGGHPSLSLPGIHQVAHDVGLRPWMSSATYEEMAGIGAALTDLATLDKDGRVDVDELLVQLVLPGLLVVDLHWLHSPHGRPSGRPAEVVLTRRCAIAQTKAMTGRYLSPIDHLYLRAGEVVQHLRSHPGQHASAPIHRILALHTALTGTGEGVDRAGLR